MKITFFIAVLACLGLNGFSQTDATAKTLANIQHIPEFKIYKAPDSTLFSNAQLKKNKPFVLIFFNPDCEHCQKETKELLAYKQELKDIQILMISPLAYGIVKEFYREYTIASMPNIAMGQDLNYAVGSKYQLRTFPSIFVYDSKGTLAKAFVGNIGVPAILDAVK